MVLSTALLIAFQPLFVRVRTVMENLEKSWNFKMVISSPGKVMEKTEIIKVLEKSWKCVIITCSFTPSLK